MRSDKVVTTEDADYKYRKNGLNTLRRFYLEPGGNCQYIWDGFAGSDDMLYFPPLESGNLTD